MQCVSTTTARPAALSSKASTAAPLRACAVRSVATRRPVVLAQVSTEGKAAERAVVVYETQAQLGRREAALAGAAMLIAAAPVGQAQALFGGPSKEEKYTEVTTTLIKDILNCISLAKDDESRPDAIKTVKSTSNSWVAKYRRDPVFSGKPSYGNVYSAVNAVVGHYNNFGTKAPIPKKRAERIVKELKDAELALSRGR